MTGPTMEEEATGLDWFFQEVEQRGLIHAAGVYAVVCWFLVQLVATVAPYLGSQDWAVGVAIAFTFAGLPPVLVVAWVFGGRDGRPPAERPPVAVSGVAVGATSEGTPPTSDRLSWPEAVLLLALAFAGGALWAYRSFAADEPPGMSAEAQAAALGELSPQALAVLPFGTVSGDPGDAYFSEGMAEEIRSALARVPSLRVASRTSTHQLASAGRPLREIAVVLGTGSVLEGSVQRAGDSLRVTVRLVDVRSDRQVWSSTYDRSLDVQSIFALEEEIARSVARSLEVELADEDGSRLVSAAPVSLEAHDLYLLGLARWHRRTGEELMRARDFFSQAVERDPGYALAHAGLANTWVLLPLYARIPVDEAMPEVRAAAELALALDSTLAEARGADGMALMAHEWRWAEAEAAFQRAIESNPSYSIGHVWYGLLLDATGRFEEARVQHQRGLELDPLSLINNEILGMHWLFAHDYDRAMAQQRRTLALEPDFPLALEYLAVTALLSGRYDEAAEAMVHWAEVTGTPPEPWAEVVAGAGSPPARPNAVRALESLEARDVLSAYRLAEFYALVGARDRALDTLERALAEHDFLLFLVNADPAFDGLHDEPRYRAILQAMGLGEDGGPTA